MQRLLITTYGFFNCQFFSPTTICIILTENLLFIDFNFKKKKKKTLVKGIDFRSDFRLTSLKGIDFRFRMEYELFLNLFLNFQAHLKQCVALLDDFKDGTLPPGTTDQQVKQPKCMTALF